MKSIGVIAAALAIGLSGCSSIIEGTSQEIVINTTPEGADCALYREGIAIGRVSETPGAATVKKTKDDITIKCNKDGYQETTYMNNSGAAGATFGNIVAGGGIGWAIDSASGADNKYDSPVNLSLVKQAETDSKAAEPPVPVSSSTSAPSAVKAKPVS
ncbi:MAG: hypothetical protein PW790_01040 [Parvibaculaceae bacterium]|nr:hypothetical protein [Parvibaculaceae bacterium]